MRHIDDNGGSSQGLAGERTSAQFCCPHCSGVITLGGGLTQAQRDVLTFVAAFIAEKQISPSITEITTGLSMHARSMVWEIVEQLCAKGFLAKVGGAGRARNIVVTDAGAA